MNQSCTQCDTENISDSKLLATGNESHNKAPEQHEKTVNNYDGEIIEYASLDESKNKYTFLSKNIVRNQSTLEDYSLKIKENVLYIYQDGIIVKAVQISDLIDSEIVQGLDQVEKRENELGFEWWTGLAWIGLAWIGLTLWNILLFVKLYDSEMLALMLVMINTIFMILFSLYQNIINR